MKRFIKGLAIAFITFLVGTAGFVFFVFCGDVPEPPPLDWEKYEKSDVMKSFEAKNKREYEKRRAKERAFLKESREDLEKDFLDKLKEKPFRKASNSATESYRFIWIPSFRPPVLIRVWDTGGEKFLTVKTGSGVSVAINGIDVEKNKRLSDAEWNEILDNIERAEFWTKPTFDENDEIKLDGASYLYDGKKDGKLHDLYRITPDADLRRLGGYLINLAELETDYENY